MPPVVPLLALLIAGGALHACRQRPGENVSLGASRPASRRGPCCDSCVCPITASGVLLREEGSRGALVEFDWLLGREPQRS